MKTVIRNGVFETNSSSCHSLTLIKGDNKKEECSFIVKSPIGKIVLLFALLDNAEDEFNSESLNIDDEDGAIDAKKLFLKKIKVDDPNELKLTFFELAEKYNNHPLFNENFDSNIDEDVDIDSLNLDFEFESYFLSYKYRSTLLKLKNILIEEYAKMNSITIDEAIDNIYLEAFGKKYKDEKKKSHGPFSCTTYFYEGSLFLCDCAFHNYSLISLSLNITDDFTDNDLREFGLKFLSDEYKFVAVERYCGVYLEVHDEDY